MGFGFRGSSPPWPYIGIGRGGLPRCGYFTGNAGIPVAGLYQQPANDVFAGQPYAPVYGPYTPQMTEEQEIGFLREQADMIKNQLEQVDTRINELENKQ